MREWLVIKLAETNKINNLSTVLNFLMESKFKVIYFKSIQLVAFILVSLLILTLFIS